MYLTGLYRIIIRNDGSGLCSSFHIVFAILEVLRTDFPGFYEKIIPQQSFLFPLFLYPGYRYSPSPSECEIKQTTYTSSKRKANLSEL